ncbi:IS110 family transposase [Panacibacter ginsenosidivorans]|uniref:IS110 family transposase n=1 Tax=Panacibacter ginsenosidivorans TaxID=1813871 RepID=A0A5B8VD40_9BACT|nr:transposase [Panacibacter ginsenosidivorans]QEC68965.1 IS110 family transposase [Panacibacter ginsenosidivorans]
MNYTQTTAVPKLFIGMDVHKKSWTVHFKTDLFDNKTVTMPSDHFVLINYVEKNFAGHEVGDIRRFNRLDELAAIVGLVPGIYQSSENKINLGLTKRSNHQLRSLLIEASWVAVRTDMALQQYYRQHAHKEPNKSIIKVAHKLLSRIRAVINSGIPYQSGVVK